MNDLSLYEALDLIRTNEAAISTQFQVWLTITFATIVAVFAGRSLLTGLIQWLVTLLYLLASLTILASCLYLAESNAQITALLLSRGAPVPAPLFAGASYLALYIAGVVTTVYFVHMNPERS